MAMLVRLKDLSELALAGRAAGRARVLESWGWVLSAVTAGVCNQWQAPFHSLCYIECQTAAAMARPQARNANESSLL
jgi:hypothetical protein